MKNLLKRVIAGTPLESLARRLRAPSAQSSNRMYDVQTVEVMKQVLQQDANCIDVGCHAGSVLREMLRLAPRGTHFAFEPIPDLHGRLVETFGGLANLHLYQLALSDTQGVASFQHVVSNPAFSGLRRRRYDRPHEQVQEIVVRTDLLDNLIPGHVPIRFIKIDVEGAELQVFMGALDTIRRCRPVIVFEHGLGAADHYGTTPEQLYEVVTVRCGLMIGLMEVWLRNRDRASLGKRAFCRQFSRGTNFYFMAYPG
jgi:FkbM family methyltransferase